MCLDSEETGHDRRVYNLINHDRRSPRSCLFTIVARARETTVEDDISIPMSVIYGCLVSGTLSSFHSAHKRGFQKSGQASIDTHETAANFKEGSGVWSPPDFGGGGFPTPQGGGGGWGGSSDFAKAAMGNYVGALVQHFC